MKVRTEGEFSARGMTTYHFEVFLTPICQEIYKYSKAAGDYQINIFITWLCVTYFNLQHMRSLW